ncbi:MAG: GspE/PulE family protein [Desulfotomaculales bacterium]
MKERQGFRRRIGDLLVEAGLINSAQLQQALLTQRQTGERLGRVLVNLGFVTEQDILNTLEMQLGIPQINLAEKLNIPLIRSLPEALLRRHKVVPVKKEGNRLMVAMSDPLNVVAIDDLRLATGLEIDPVLAREQEIDEALQKAFTFSGLEKVLAEMPDGTEAAETQVLDLTPEAAGGAEVPLVRLVNSLIAQAVNEKASDIHIEPQERKVLVRFRQDGLLREVMTLSPQTRLPLVSRVKIMAGMDIAEKRLPQDGRIQIKLGGRNIDLRVSSMPTIFGEKIVLRVLDKSVSILPIEELGFEEYNFTRFLNLLRHAYGMVLITGPTGSGKTTTLYAVLNKLRSPELNIVTIEDPVEYVLEGINQTQVNVKAGLTFASGLRSILRQDPDVIMVGEVRDRETAEIAVRAASTGHLVLSTLHTNDAAGALTRLIDMGVEPFLVASSVLGVVAQRLVRVLCPYCRQKYVPSPDAAERMFMSAAPTSDVTLYAPGRCARCDQTGYRGRISIQEVLISSGNIRSLINQKRSADEIKQQAIKEGMVTLQQDGINKARRGITSLQEIMRVAYTTEER